MKPEVTLVIVSYNTSALLQKCLESVFLSALGNFIEVIVVDNASSDDSVEMVHLRFPSVRLFPSRVNLGFAAANNLAFKVAKAPYIILLNSDAFLNEECLKISLERMRKNPHIGIAGVRLVGKEGERQPSARDFPTLWNEWLLMTGLSSAFPDTAFFAKASGFYYPEKECYQTDWVTGAFMIASKSALKKVGYFDERYFMYFEEVDLCKKIKALGLEVWYWGDVLVTHFSGESIKKMSSEKKEMEGSSLLKWQQMSAYLYFTKHFGKFYAIAYKWMKNGWQRLRLIKNSLSKSEESIKKVNLAKYYLEKSNAAWKETKGGHYSPPHPWER